MNYVLDQESGQNIKIALTVDCKTLMVRRLVPPSQMTLVASHQMAIFKPDQVEISNCYCNIFLLHFPPVTNSLAHMDSPSTKSEV